MEEELINLNCMNCSAIIIYPAKSMEARGVFNPFCRGTCEDEYALKL